MNLKKNPWELSSVLEYIGPYSDDIFGFDRVNAKRSINTTPEKIRENLAGQYLSQFDHCNANRQKIEEDMYGIPSVPTVYCGVESRPSSDRNRILMPPQNVIARDCLGEFYLEVYDETQVKDALNNGWREIKNGIYFTPRMNIPQQFLSGEITSKELPSNSVVLSVRNEDIISTV